MKYLQFKRTLQNLALLISTMKQNEKLTFMHIIYKSNDNREELSQIQLVLQLVDPCIVLLFIHINIDIHMIQFLSGLRGLNSFVELTVCS